MKKLKHIVVGVFISAFFILTSALADSVTCGDFVKIYDPSVGENEKWYINDHCFIRDGHGLWHLFGITRQELAKPPTNGICFNLNFFTNVFEQGHLSGNTARTSHKVVD